LAAKISVQQIHGKVKIPTNTFLGDRGIIQARNLISRTGVTSGVIGVTSQIKF